MEYKELIELAAAKIKAAKELADAHPDGDLPEDVESQFRQLLGEYHEAHEKAQKASEWQKTAQAVKHGYDFYHKGAGPPAVPAAPAARAEWKRLGEWIIATVIADRKGAMDPRLEPVEAVLLPDELKELKALSGDIGVSGGYLIPTEFIANLMSKAAETAIVRPRATPVPMTSRTAQIPTLDQTALPSGGSAYMAGIVMQWLEESEDKPEVDVAFKLLEMTAHEVAGWLPVPNSLLADSAISLEALFPKLFGTAMADEEDYRFLNGDGVGKPLGVIAAPASLWVNRDTATTFKWVDVVAMLEQFQPGGKGVWVIAQSVMDQVYNMQDAANRLLWVPNMSGPGPETLVGKPIIWTEKLPALGTKGDVLLCDFSYYLIGDRERPAMATSVHERFRKNQTTFRISARLDGQPWLSAAVPLRDASSSVSPFVGLDVP